MVQIDDKVISLDLFEKKFICNLHQCHGECCVEGESGAPLEEEETQILESIYPQVKPYLTEMAVDEIEKQGKWVIDADGDKVTPIINGRECVYALREPNGTWKCAIEQAYYDGKINWKKPISCHLYPIRVTPYKNFDALNYHQWFVCKPAIELGNQLGTPVFRFLKEPLIRKYGEPFYLEMENVAQALENEKTKY